MKRWFKENKDLALAFDVATILNEDTQLAKSRPNSPIKPSTPLNPISSVKPSSPVKPVNDVKSSPTKPTIVKPIDVNNNMAPPSAATKAKGTSDTIRTEVMNTVFIVKNNTNAEESADSGPLGLINKEAPHYGKSIMGHVDVANRALAPLGQLDPKTKSMVDLICKIELIAQETNLKKVWIWDGTCNPPGSMLLVVWNKSLPNFGNPTDKWVVLTRVKISKSPQMTLLLY